jgi:predicted permease
VFGILLVAIYLGFGWAFRGKLQAGTLSTVALNIALPALALHSMHAATAVAWLELAIVWGMFGVSFLLWRTVGRWRGWSAERIACLTLTAGLGNTCFLGFPLLEAYVGSQALPLAVQIDQLGTFLMMSSVGIAYAAHAGGAARTARQTTTGILRFPGFWATLLGLLLRGVQWPVAFDDALIRVGALLGPLALLAVGTRLARPTRSVAGCVALGLGFKLGVAPALALGVLTVFGRTGLDMQVTVAEIGMAPAAMAVLLTLEHDLEPELGAAMISVGVPVSLLTVWGWVWAVGIG